MREAMRKLWNDEKGAAIIELALIAPVFALMTIGIVDMSTAYSRKLALEQGAQRAIEKILQTTQDDTVDDTIKKEAVCQVNGWTVDGSNNTTCNTTSPITKDNVTISYRLECTNADGSVEVKNAVAADVDCAASQRQAQYVTVTITDKYTPMFPIHFGSYNTQDGTYHLTASAGMRTQ
jgi:Flp pilus assembly protein TadG